MNNILVQSNNEITKVNIEDQYTNMLTKETKRAYVQAIKEFFGKDLCDITIEEMQAVTTDMVNQYATMLAKKGIKHGTINRKLAALHSFYKFLCRRSVGIMSYNPLSTDEGCIRFKNAQSDYVNKRVLTPDEIKNMFIVAKQDESLIGVRDLLILELLATTGMRRAEICGIMTNDLFETDGKMVIEITGKGSKKRLVVLSNNVVGIVKQYLAMRGVKKGDNVPLLVSHANRGSASGKISTSMVYRVVKKFAELIGIDADTLSPHCFRHTYATQCIDMGIELNDVKDLMGHASINTTLRYNHSYNVVKNNPANKLDSMFND